jgi:glycerol-3-phosphate dehydrogenase
MSFFRSRRFVRPLLYVSAVVACGAGVLYISYRPRNIPGLEPAVVPPPQYRYGKLVPRNFPSIKSRAEQILELKRRSELTLVDGNQGENQDGSPYDLVIIGAGATGSGIALDAVTRGLKVAIIERDDFSAGTSSKSTKLVHGGVRYLEKAVWELDYSQ